MTWIPPLAWLRVNERSTSFGRPQRPGYVEHWTECRTQKFDQFCCLCWERIPKGAPGSAKGTRYTRSWIEVALGLWHCLACHDEYTRAELARIEQAQNFRSTPSQPAATAA